jgi:hypothetical protein
MPRGEAIQQHGIEEHEMAGIASIDVSLPIIVRIGIQCLAHPASAQRTVNQFIVVLIGFMYEQVCHS